MYQVTILQFMNVSIFNMFNEFYALHAISWLFIIKYYMDIMHIFIICSIYWTAVDIPILYIHISKCYIFVCDIDHRVYSANLSVKSILQ